MIGNCFFLALFLCIALELSVSLSPGSNITFKSSAVIIVEVYKAKIARNRRNGHNTIWQQFLRLAFSVWWNGHIPYSSEELGRYFKFNWFMPLYEKRWCGQRFRWEKIFFEIVSWSFKSFFLACPRQFLSKESSSL